MKKNNIFNMQRFLGLIGTGINRSNNARVKYLYIITELLAFCLIMILIPELLKNLDFDTARNVVTKLYQVLYIIFLSIPIFRLSTSQDRFTQWSLLPASAFEKYVFITLVLFLWRTIIFVIAMYFVDYLVWMDTPFVRTMDLTECHIRIGDFFMLRSYHEFLPLWLYHIAVFFFFTAVPLFIGAHHNTTFNRYEPFGFVVIFYFMVKAFISDDSVLLYGYIPLLSMIAFIYNIVLSIKRSRNPKA